MTSVFATSFFILFVAGYIWVASSPWLRYEVKYLSDAEIALVRFLWGYLFYVAAAAVMGTYRAFTTASPTDAACYPCITGLYVQLGTFRAYFTEYVLPALDPSDKAPSQHLALIKCSLMAVSLSGLCALLWLFLQKNSPDFQRFDARRKYLPLVKHGGPLEEFLVRVRARDTFTPVMITLKNRKAYIGFIRELPRHDHHKRTLSIVPLLSGHLIPDTLKFQKDVDYKITFAALQYIIDKNLTEKETFTYKDDNGKEFTLRTKTLIDAVNTGLVIDYEDILSARLWDSGLSEYFSHETQAAKDEKISAPKTSSHGTRRKKSTTRDQA